MRAPGALASLPGLNWLFVSPSKAEYHTVVSMQLGVGVPQASVLDFPESKAAPSPKKHRKQRSCLRHSFFKLWKFCRLDSY